MKVLTQMQMTILIDTIINFLKLFEWKYESLSWGKQIYLNFKQTAIWYLWNKSAIKWSLQYYRKIQGGLAPTHHTNSIPSRFTFSSFRAKASSSTLVFIITPFIVWRLVSSCGIDESSCRMEESSCGMDEFSMNAIMFPPCERQTFSFLGNFFFSRRRP